MTLNRFIEGSLAQEETLLGQVAQDLTPEELTWRPGPAANTIGWTLWHMLRVEDMWVQFYAQHQLEVWERDGWHQRFGLPTRDNGFGHTPEQVAAFPTLDLGTLLEYGRAVRAATLEYLRSRSEQDFQSVPRERRPEITVEAIFRQLIGELYQHLGQLAYLKGLQRGAGALPANFAAA
jgi:uncharacterized damage-inducible protein DinB